MTFQSCLERGLYYEREALKYFEVESFVQHKGYFKDYDLSITHTNGSKTLVEVKADFMAKKTGNVAIECECNGKQSGITATKADVWAIFAVRRNGAFSAHDCYIVPTRELTDIASRCRCVRGGDGYRARMHLVPLVLLEKYKKIPIH